MNRVAHATTGALIALLAASLGTARADDFNLDWRTVDGGGVMYSTGGDFVLSGTVGQPDAGTLAMTGGDFELAGGFWPGAPAYQLGDLNCDGWVNNGDIDPFVMALTDPPGYTAAFPDCDINLADINGDGWTNNGDIDAFIDLLSS